MKNGGIRWSEEKVILAKRKLPTTNSTWYHPPKNSPITLNLNILLA
jgi:hypothetical protein